MNLRNESGNSAYDGAGRLNHVIWHNKVFMGLYPRARLALIYLLAGPEFSPSGLFTIDPVSVGAAINTKENNGGWGLAGRKALALLDREGLIEYAEPVCWLKGSREFYTNSDIPGIQEQIDRDVARIAPGVILDRYRAYYNIDNSGARARSDMYLALCGVMNVSPFLDNPALAAFAHDLTATANYTHEDIELWYGRGGWWYKNDWRGKRGSYPAIHSIRETLQHASEGHGPEPQKKTHDELLVAEIEKLLRIGAGASSAKEKLGEDTFAKLRAHRRWADWGKYKEIKWEVYKAINNE